MYYSLWIEYIFQVILVQLEIISAISEKSISWLCDNLGIILGLSLFFASYGLPHHTQSVLQYLLPTPFLFSDNKSDTGKVSC